MNIWRATYKYTTRGSVGSEPKTATALFLTATNERSLYDLERAIAQALGATFNFPALVSAEFLGESGNEP